MEKIKDHLVVIDADSIIYILGPGLENMPLEPLGIIKLDEFLKDILVATRGRHYVGFFGGNKGVNFRKNLAVTTKYKGSRDKDKPEWFKFWAPIFKKHMETVWKFQPCHNIEADDAAAIAAEKYKDLYEKVYIASPDKDLLQIPNVWFYNYDKRYTVWVDEETALTKYLAQLIKGDQGDDIPGLFGAGDAVANREVLRIMKLGLSKDKAIDEILTFYYKWHEEILLEKQHKKQEKAYLIKYKEDNDISRLTATLKSTALKDFVLDTSMILGKKAIKKLFLEQKALLTMLTTETEGKKHEFTLNEPIVDSRVDWNDIITYDEELADLPDEEDFDFIEDEL
jgi:5'-3' exonuclease